MLFRSHSRPRSVDSNDATLLHLIRVRSRIGDVPAKREKEGKGEANKRGISPRIDRVGANQMRARGRARKFVLPALTAKKDSPVVLDDGSLCRCNRGQSGDEREGGQHERGRGSSLAKGLHGRAARGRGGGRRARGQRRDRRRANKRVHTSQGQSCTSIRARRRYALTETKERSSRGG